MSSSLQASLNAARTPQAFTFHSPPLHTRHVQPTNQAEVTDTSAASTPTHGVKHEFSPSLASLSYSRSLPASASAGADSPSNASGMTGGGYAPVRRSKDKQKHSESENRRRMRLRAKFNALREASQCNKKDRFNILQGACNKLQEYEERIQDLEQEKAALLGGMPAAAASSSASSAISSMPSLSTPLSNFPMFTHLACCYISLDGRILDANDAFVQLFQFNSPNASSMVPSTPATAAGRADAIVGASASGVSSAAAGSDIYSSSIFALTHHGELIHTLSILRNLLCGVMGSYECSKTCVSMSGAIIPANMTITSVTSHGKIVMFLVFIVPKQPTSGMSHGSTPVPTPMPTPVHNGVDIAANEAGMDDSMAMPPPQQQLLHPPHTPSAMPPAGSPSAYLSLPPASGLQPQQSAALPMHPSRSSFVHHPTPSYGRHSYAASPPHPQPQQQQQQQQHPSSHASLAALSNLAGTASQMASPIDVRRPSAHMPSALMSSASRPSQPPPQQLYPAASYGGLLSPSTSGAMLPMSLPSAGDLGGRGMSAAPMASLAHFPASSASLFGPSDIATPPASAAASTAPAHPASASSLTLMASAAGSQAAQSSDGSKSAPAAEAEVEPSSPADSSADSPVLAPSPVDESADEGAEEGNTRMAPVTHAETMATASTNQTPFDNDAEWAPEASNRTAKPHHTRTRTHIHTPALTPSLSRTNPLSLSHSLALPRSSFAAS